MSKKWIALLVLYLGLLTVCIVALYAIPSVQGMLEKTYIAEYGTLDVKDDVAAFVVKDEYVFVAKQSSDIKRIIEEGELVKAATRVVELEAREGDESKADSDIVKELGAAVKQTEKGYTNESGYVSYRVSGAEAELTVENMGSLTKADYEDLCSRRFKDTTKGKASEGEPVFSIIKNSKWYLVYYTSKENAARYKPDSYAYMDVNGESVRVRVHNVEELENETRISLECKSFFDGFLEMRTLKAPITLASAEGLIIHQESIIEHDGREGVFAKNKLGEHIFKPVSVIATDGEKCVVYSDIYLDAEGNFVETIGTYDEIIAVPSEEDIASLDKKE
ncbi:MAG: hypothetical protein IKE52_07320 [Mogibacterium sp.]|nr:hypothetical protein [Mogibacterium sp.]